MSEHTPGPWVAICCDVTGERPVGDSGIRYWYVDPVGEYRGSVCNVHAAEGIGGITIAERDANARLIAAAPIMYNFLASKAGCGDNEAIAIMEKINGDSQRD